jgi:hypothetical protein
MSALVYLGSGKKEPETFLSVGGGYCACPTSGFGCYVSHRGT